jgi:hypothetical protein
MQKFIGKWVRVAIIYNGNKYLRYINDQEGVSVS